MRKLKELIEVVRKVNPSLIQQINKAKPSNPSDEMHMYKYKEQGPPS